VYLIVDLGGQDLFEFFDKHLDGVDDADARQIVLGIVRPISYIHQMGICHRDLKPENILLHAEPGQTIDVSMLKICDFGLCCQNIKKHDKGLSEFCGSPGFFAPEMILNGGRYNGLLVDVWSIGCIMLELTLGHDEFCKSWMTAYDYNSIQRESIFEDTITDAVEGLDLSKVSVRSSERSCVHCDRPSGSEGGAASIKPRAAESQAQHKGGGWGWGGLPPSTTQVISTPKKSQKLSHPTSS